MPCFSRHPGWESLPGSRQFDHPPSSGFLANMNKFFKLAASLIALVFTVVLVAFLYLVNLDPNDHKTFIADKFREQTGLDLELNGEIQLTLYPWLGVTVKNVIIHNVSGFSETPLLQAEELAFRSKLLPMLNQEYEVDTIRLIGTRLYLETNEAGESNWNKALPAGDESSDDAAPTALNNLVIGSVDIRGAALVFNDRFNKVRYAIENLSVSTGELVYGAPVELTLGFDASSSQPALAADVTLNGTIVYDLDNQRYDISPLNLGGTLTGPSVPDGATSFTLDSSVSLDFASDLLTLRELSLNALDAQINANINGVNFTSENPVYQVNLAAAGNDLSILFRILENEALVQQISNLNSRAFRVNGLIESSPNQGNLTVTDLDASLLDARITGNVSARNLQSGTPVINGNLNASGPDLPTLLEVAGQLQGGQNSPLSRYGRELQQAPNQDFLLNSSFDADLATGNVVIPVFEARVLGTTMSGNVTARNVNTETPLLQGRLNASGPDLPILLRIAGQLTEGPESSLNRYGRQLRNAANKNFVINAPFDIDMATGDMDISNLDASTLGFQLNGNLQARDFQASNGTMRGQFTLTGRNVGPVLTAIDQQDLGEVIQSVALDLTINGTRQNLSLSPLSLEMVLSGPRIANGPASLTVNADSVLNLEAETIDTRNLTASGLGLNLGGAFTARNISSNPSYNGQINIPAFNLKRFLQQLNQDVPETTDNTVFQSLALSTSFTGTDNDIRLNNFDMTLDDSRITGNFTLAGFDNPATDFDLAITRINLDRYLTPSSESSEVTNTALPQDSLRSLNLKGKVSIGQLTYSHLNLSDFNLTISASDGMLALNPIAANLYQGRYSGNIQLDSRGDMPAASVDTSLTGINLAPLLQDFMDASYISGNGNIQLSLNGRGNDTATIKRNLNGSGSLKLEDGVLQGVDVGSVLNQIESMIREQRPRSIVRGERTPFDSFSANIDVSSGIVSTNNLLIDSSGFDLTGRGVLANLTNDTIAFNLVANVDETPASDEQAYDIGGYSVPIACNGALADPTCLPDIQAILAGAISSAVQRGLTNLLERAAGVQQQSQQNTDQAGDTANQQEEPEDPREVLINRALDSLFKRN
jgi:uncharacterized protein involved in outer membrane biogenesis